MKDATKVRDLTEGELKNLDTDFESRSIYAIMLERGISQDLHDALSTALDVRFQELAPPANPDSIDIHHHV